ncbi:CHAP domain-containing protein [Rothia uropygialis]|uniref:CHAP domain-containing protein n=1 Tax=Kocuria sp. 36 TaxID=1415402 RepID=UPI00101D9284|nr:CHAP domain-containing protein [Kocuria sp. 36]
MGDFFRATLGFAVKLALRKFLVPVAAVGALFGVLVLVVLMFTAGSTGTAARADCGEVGSNAPGTSTSAGTTTGGNASETASQKKILQDIDSAVSEAGYSGKTTRIVAIAAMGESTLENLGHGDEGAGVTNPDGSATTSKGILQQQDNWGSLQDRLDPKKATRLFLFGPHEKGGGLADLAGWEDMPETIAINRIQQNSDPSHYAQQGRIEYVDKLLKEANIDVNREGKTHGGAGAQSGASDTKADNMAEAAGNCVGTAGTGQPGGAPGGKDTYPFKDVPGPGIYTEEGAGFYKGECTSYAMWKLAEHYGAKGDPASWPIGNTKGGNGTQLSDGQNWRSAWEARGWKVSTQPTANSVAWWGAKGAEGIGPAGHVAWVDAVKDDGTFEISEYNNAGLAPPGHKYDHRPSVKMDDPQAPNAFLVPPDKDKL